MPTTSPPPPFKLLKLKRVYVKTDEGVERAMALLKDVTVVGADTETTGLDPYLSKVRLLTIASEEAGYTFIFDLFKIPNLEPLREFLSRRIVSIWHNAPFDTKMLIHHLGVYPEMPLDTCVMGQMLSRYEDDLKYDFESHKLIDMVPRWLDVEISKDQQLSDWSADELSQVQLDYAAFDGEVLIPLSKVLLCQIEREGMEESLMTEMLMTLVVAGLEYYGIYSDPDYRARLAAELTSRIKSAEREIAVDYLPNPQPDLFEPKPINLNSHDQKRLALEKRWKVKLEIWDSKKKTMRPSVAAESILRHKAKDPRLVDLLVGCETLKKCVKTHAVDVDEFVHPITQRIHCHWFQWGQPHSRLTCTKLNMLNVTRQYTIGPGVADEQSIRWCEMSFRHQFRPAPGKLYVKSDYDQLQLRALAEVTQDKTMLEAYRNDEDLHCKTGSVIAGREITKADKEPRSNGKETNFAVGFMVGPKGLQAQMLGKYQVWKEEEELEGFISAYFRLYPGVKQYHQTYPDTCRRRGKIEVRGGRQVLLKDGAEPSTEAVNFPCVLLEQSGIRLAMGRMARVFWHEFKQRHILDRPKIVLSVYDEIVVECMAEDAERVKAIMDAEMVDCMKRYILTVPIKTDAKICDSWGA